MPIRTCCRSPLRWLRPAPETAATSVTHNAIQTLGGIGFTWEHDVHFFLKRARASAQMMGSARAHRDNVATLVGLG